MLAGPLLLAAPRHGGGVVAPVVVGVDGGVVQIAAGVVVVIFILHVHLAEHALVVRGRGCNRRQIQVIIIIIIIIRCLGI